MIKRMITVRRLVAYLTLLLPFEAMAQGGAARQETGRDALSVDAKADCARHAPLPCPAAPRPTPEDTTLLLPKLPLMPSACRPLRQYRSFSHDRLQRAPCYFV